MGQYSLAEAKPIAAPLPTVAKGAYRLEEAKPLAQDGGIISSPPPSRRDSAGDAVSGVMDGLKEAIKAIPDAVRHPLDSAYQMFEASKDQYEKAVKAAGPGRDNKGDVAGFIQHALGMFPVLGPMGSNLLDAVDSGADSYEVGKRAGNLLSLKLVPEITKKGIALAGKAVDVAPSVGPALKAGVKAAGPDVAAPKPPPSGPRPPPPPSPVNVGKLMSTAKSGAVNVGVRVLEKAFGLPPGSGKIVKNIVEAVREEMAGKTTEVAPPAPTVVEAPPVASGTPVRPPLRGKQFGTFNDPTAPPLPAGVTPAGPVLPPLVEAAPPVAPGVPLRPPLRGRQFGTTVAKMMREEVPGRQFGTSSQSRLVPAEVPAATVPAEVPPAAVETPQPATPAPSAAGEPVTAATLMEEVANPAAQVNNPNYDWRAPEGITAAFKQYLKDSGFDVVPDRPEFDPTNPKAQGKFGGGAKTQVNMDAKANRFVEYLKANKLEPTPDNVARATQTLNEADHPSAHTLEKIYTQMGYDALDVEELLARSMAKAESPAASASAAPNPLASAPEVPKAAAKPRLDHGELNLPLDKRGGGSINSQLDRYKADLAKAEKAAAKEAAGIRKSDKAIARDLFTQHAQALAESTAAKRGIPVSDSIKLMDSMAKWEPKKLIKLLEKYQADNPKSTTVGELMEKAKVKK